MKIRELISNLNQISPFMLQENFDNSGVQFANLEEEIHKILICLDVTEEIIQEAMEKRCNVILSHHPLFFQPITQITKQDNPLIYQLIYHHINLIAFHTNFDLAENGLNDYVAKLIGLNKVGTLQPDKEKIYKLAVYVPEQYHHTLQEALFQAGAGRIGNYSETSFSFFGQGSFRPLTGATPFLGKVGERETVKEIKLETIFYERNLKNIITALHQNHPYEEPAYDIYQLVLSPREGLGLLAKIDSEETLEEFAKILKKKLKIPYLRIIRANNKNIQKIALCTGSGGSLIKQCIDQQVDLFITGDINHHKALQAKEMGLNIIDLEHFYTERYFVPAIRERLIHFHIPEESLIISQKMTSPFQLL